MDSEAQEIKNKPICYLDIDDTLLPSFKSPLFHKYGIGIYTNIISIKAGTFFKFLNEYFEIRWLTGWAPGGDMAFDDSYRLSKYLDVPIEVIFKAKNPLPIKFDPSHAQGVIKYVGIDFNDPREFIWVQEDIYQLDKQFLTEKQKLDRFIKCDISMEEDAMEIAQRHILRLFPNIYKDSNVSKYLLF